MCGIIASFNYDKNKKIPVNRFIVNQYQKQIQRGTQGFGVMMIDEKNKIRIERSVRDSKAIADIYLNPTQKMIFHHRLPSSSENTIKQTHPIEIDNGSLKDKYFVIHNGVIQNASERLQYQSKELGFDITTHEDDMANDSEALAIDIARFIEKQTNKIKSAGSAAFIAIRVDKETNEVKKIYYGRNNNPLKLAMTRGSIKISSEGPGVKIKEDMLYGFDLENYKISKTKMAIPESMVEEKEEIGFQEPTENRERNKAEKEFEKQYGKPMEEKEKENNLELDEILEDEATSHMPQIEEELFFLIQQMTDRDNLFSEEIDNMITEYLPILIEQLKILHKDVKNTFTQELIKEAEELRRQPSLITE